MKGDGVLDLLLPTPAEFTVPATDWVSPQDCALEQRYHCSALGT